MKAKSVLFAVLCYGCAAPPARAVQHNVMLASQHQWEGKRGFYLSLENNSPDATARLGTVKVVLGVGDGANWRFVMASPAWRVDRDYRVKAVVGPANAELWLDGERLGESAGRFAPVAGPVIGYQTVAWAPGPAGYLVSPSALALSAGDRTASATPDRGANRPIAVRLFEPLIPMRLNWTTGAAETTTVEATFRFQAAPSLASLAPFVDRYGQSRHADWPGKVARDEDLKRAAEDEAKRSKGWARPKNLDAYGGATDAGWKETASGFFRVARRNGVWWLITPAGNPVYYTGFCTADIVPFEKTPVSEREKLFAELPPKAGDAAAAWGKDVWGAGDGADYVSFYTANVVRKYGSGWREKSEQSIRDRVARWGFSGLGKWSARLSNVPDLPVLYYGGVPHISRHPDIFNPAVREEIREALRSQIAPRVSDPYLIGWSIGNEYPEIILASEVNDIMAGAATLPAKRALVDYGVDTLHSGSVADAAKAWGVEAATRDALYAATPKPNDSDREMLRRFFAGRYYRFLYETVKSLDPNHLYFGFWIVPGWWENEEDWRLITPYCDVIGYDRYADTFSDAMLDRLMTASDKPVLCGEFAFPPHYGGTRGFGVYTTWSDSDAEAGRKYAAWTRDAARSPYCVGQFYFQYRDQPITGRGPGRGDRLVIDERFAFGLVDITDRPKWDLVEPVRAANLAATRARLDFTARAQSAAAINPKGD